MTANRIVIRNLIGMDRDRGEWHLYLSHIAHAEVIRVVTRCDWDRLQSYGQSNTRCMCRGQVPARARVHKQFIGIYYYFDSRVWHIRTRTPSWSSNSIMRVIPRIAFSPPTFFRCSTFVDGRGTMCNLLLLLVSWNYFNAFANYYAIFTHLNVCYRPRRNNTHSHTRKMCSANGDCSNSLLPTGALYVASDWMALRPCERWTCELLKQSWKMMMTARRQWVIEECNNGQADLYEHMHMNTFESYYRNTLPVNHLVSLTDCARLREIERQAVRGDEQRKWNHVSS